MKGIKGGFSLFVTLAIFLLFISGMLQSAPPVYGEEADKKKKDLPPRAIALAPEYTGVILPEGEDLSIDLEVINKGRQDENIDLSITSVPEGWTARIKTYSFDVTGVHVASDKTKSLTLKAEPEKGVGPGKYTFGVRAQTEDGAFKVSRQVTVTVKKKEEEKKTSEDLEITTSYPVLQGPTDAKFEFSMEVENKTDKDAIFNLIGQGPENWEVNFKPAYEDKFFSSLRIKANQSESMAVLVKPFPLAEPGKYPIKVKVSSEKAKAEAELSVVLTGTYTLEAGTATGLLSLNAYQGKESNISFLVKNTGSAMQNKVQYTPLLKPENWKVEFKPEYIETLEPGDLKQVELMITPADQALVGDYSVGINVEGEKATKTMEFRVTVRPSTAWGWVGIIIIFIVVAGLVVLFIRLGRR
jgi:uncharacterized membrane protein